MNKIEVLNESKRYAELNGGGGGGSSASDKDMANLLKTNIKFDKALNLDMNITGTMLIDTLKTDISIKAFYGAVYDSDNKQIRG